MTAASKGVYITLLCLIYEAEAPLPQSWDTLARRCGCTLPAFKRAVEALQDDGKIEVTGAGIWSEKCAKHIAQRRERQGSAKAAAKTRWEKIKENQSPNDSAALRTQCQPEPEPDIRDTNVSLSIAAPPKKPPDLFPEFWDRYPKRVGKAAAQKAYTRAMKKITHDDLMFALSERLPALKSKEKQFRPNPATWLNQERWTDDINADSPAHRNSSTDTTAREIAFAARAARSPSEDCF